MIDPNQSSVDMYLPFHVLWGGVMQRMGIGWMGALGASLAWEWVIERWYKERYPEIFPAPSQDSRINRVFDTLGVMAGWYLMSRQKGVKDVICHH